MGLLDGVFGSSMDDPKTQGMLALGLGLLGGRGNFGQVLSQAGMQGMGAYQQGQDRQAQAKQRALQAQMAQMQLDEQIKKQEQEKRDRALIEQFSMPRYQPGASIMKPGSMDGGPMPFNPLEMLQQGASPQAVQTVGAFQPKIPEPMVTKPGDVIRDPRNPSRIIAQNDPAADEFARALASAGIDPKSPQGQALIQQRVQKMVSHPAPVQVSYGAPQVVQGPDGKPMLVQTSNRGGPAQPVMGPDGKPMRPVGGADKPMNDTQANANLYATRMLEADKIINSLEGKYSRTWLAARQTAGEGVIGMAANSRLPAEAQQIDQAQRDFINAVLRRESGAVISPGEFANARQQYFPQPGDSVAVVKQKAANRQTAIRGIRAAAGVNAPVGGDAPVNDDPLGLRQ